jgi:hypothetical protein
MWPIDTSKVVLMFGSAEPALDFDTKQQQVDRDSGALLWIVHLMRVDGARPELVKVKVTGEPKNLNPGDLVRCEGLVCRNWTNNGTGGMSFRADHVVPAAGAAPKAA